MLRTINPTNYREETWILRARLTNLTILGGTKTNHGNHGIQVMAMILQGYDCRNHTLRRTGQPKNPSVWLPKSQRLKLRKKNQTSQKLSNWRIPYTIYILFYDWNSKIWRNDFILYMDLWQERQNIITKKSGSHRIHVWFCFEPIFTIMINRNKPLMRIQSLKLT